MPNLIPHYIYTAFLSGTFQGSLQATALFADVSGFTQISESLMGHGKNGCEVLTQTLNTVFSPLVEVIYAYGGFITNFAGDAFVAIFPENPDDPAQQRARSAAVFTREFFEHLDKIDTPYGTYKLNVKIGLGVGAVEWGIIPVKKSHTYFFRGSAVQTAIEAQSRANANEICSYSAGAYEILAYQEKSPIPVQTHFTGFTLEQLRPFVPDEVLDVTVNGEFRNVVSVFIGFTSDIPTHQLVSFVQAVYDSAALYEGYVNKLDFNDKGGGIFVLFGAPTSHENDVVRAADFLLTLRQKFDSVVWRAGFTRGMVYSGFVGGKERSEYTVIGSATNLAARLMSASQNGQVWVDASTAESLKRPGFQLQSAGQHHLKGIRPILDVYNLVNRNATRNDHELFTGETVGRNAELQKLQAWVSRITHNKATEVMIIYGDAGIGKSRLVYELQQGQTETKYFFCITDEIVRQSLNPFRYFLRKYFDQSPEHSPALNRSNLTNTLDRLIAAFPQTSALDQEIIHNELDRSVSFLGAMVDVYWDGSLYERLDPKLRAENTQRALKNLLLAESLCQPVILVIEDGHWLDTDSLEMLRVLLRNVADYPLGVIITSRYGDDGSSLELQLDDEVKVSTLNLGKLDAASTHVFAENLLGGKISDEIFQLVQNKAEGNPFFTEQLLLDLKERGNIEVNEQSLWQITPSKQFDIPLNVNAVLVARLDRLREEVKRVVQTAAVLGREFEVTVLSAMLKDDKAIEEKVREAEENTIWAALAEIRYIFRHALLREAAYQMLFRTHLSELHRLAAEAIEQLYQSDLKKYYTDLAYHYHEADDEVSERLYARLAGIQAFERFAVTEALEYFNRALALTSEPELRYELLLLCEEALHIHSNRESQENTLAELESLVSQFTSRPDLQGEVIYRRSRYQEIIGQMAQAVETARKVTDISGVSPEILTKAYLQWGLALQRQSFYREAAERLKHGIELAQKHSFEALEAKLMASLGSTLLHSGEYDASYSYFSDALVKYQQVGDRQGEANMLQNIGAQSFMMGNFSVAREKIGDSLKIYREIGDRYGEGMALGNIGAVASGENDHYSALHYTEQTLRLQREGKNRFGEVHTLGNLGIINGYLGNFELAEKYALETLEVNQIVGNHQRSVHTYCSLSMIYIQRKNYETAHQYALKALQIVNDVEMLPYKVLALKMNGLTLEGLARYTEAIASFQEALALEKELGEEHLIAETLAGLARMALQQGELSQALVYAVDVLKRIEQYHLAGLNEPIRVLLTCYDVFIAHDDDRADFVLQMARTELHKQAHLIKDNSLRESFLNNISANRRVVDLGGIDLNEIEEA